MKVQTDKLASAVAILGNAVSKNDIKTPLSSAIELSTKDGILYGYTFDMTNFLRVEIGPCNEEFLATVEYTQFHSIVKSIKSDEIELTTTKNALNIKSKTVKCKLPLYVDANGNIGKAKKASKPDNVDFTPVDVSKVKSYIPIFKSICRQDFSVECYRYVYFGSKGILVSDTSNVILINDVLFNEDLLLTMKSISLLSLFDECEYYINTEKHVLYISNDTMNLTIVDQNKELFQYDDMIDLFNSLQIPYQYKLKASSLSEGLGVSNVFQYNSIFFEFNKDGCWLKMAPVDFVYQVDETPGEDFVFTTTKDIIKKFFISNEELTIDYGIDDLIKVTADNISGIFCRTT